MFHFDEINILILDRFSGLFLIGVSINNSLSYRIKKQLYVSCDVIPT